MRITILFILISCFLPATAQQDTLNRTDSRGRKTGYWISYSAPGVKAWEGSFREGNPAGRMVRYHPNGKVKAEMNYRDDGIRVDARLFDESGALRAKGSYAGRIREGAWTYRTGKGFPLYRINYLNGNVNGEALRYDAGGNLLEQTVWKENRMDGFQVIFYPGGQPQARISYRDGVMDGPYQLLFPDGTQEVLGQYRDGLKTGRWTYFLNTGGTDYVLEYDKGKLLNPDVLDERQRASFELYERNRGKLRDPQDFLANPAELIGR